MMEYHYSINSCRLWTFDGISYFDLYRILVLYYVYIRSSNNRAISGIIISNINPMST